MRERHPIDDRFNKALANAETEPPKEVRDALAVRMGWNVPHKPATWKPLMLALLGLVGIGAALYHVHMDETAPRGLQANSHQSTAFGENAKADAPIPGQPPVLDNPSENNGQEALADASTANAPHVAGTFEQPSPKVSATAVAALGMAGPSGEGVVSGPSNSVGHVHTAPSTTVGRAERSATASSETEISTPPSRPGQMAPREMLGTSAFLSGGDNNDLFLTHSFEPVLLPDVSVSHLSMIPIDLEPGILSGTPRTLGPLPQYVVPRGTWWAGPYVGLGTVNGQWRGADVAELQAAERWRGTAQAGLLVGREWRSNWAISFGVGVSRVRSSFSAETPGETTLVTDVDTSWLGNNHIPTGQLVYTWVIDSLVTEVPGEPIRSDARNLYTAVQMPVSLHWHTTWRRFRLGAFGGINAWIPTQRKGLTLVRSGTDGTPTTLTLQDALVNERFNIQLHGQVGFSLGYTLTEQLALFAEPLITAPLLSFDGRNSPWLTRPVFQIRLQHAFRTRSY